MVAAAVIGGAVIGAGASAYSGGKAADATKDAAQQASDTELQMYYQNREDFAPYKETGENALNILSQMYTGTTYDNETGEMIESGAPDYSSFYESPDYTFAYDQGMKAVEQSLAKRGLGGAGDSGAAMKELTNYGQGMASQQFNNYRNTLSSLAGVGQTATSQLGTMGQQVATNVGSNQIAAGDARASSYLNTGAAVNQAANSYGQYSLLKAGGYLG